MAKKHTTGESYTAYLREYNEMARKMASRGYSMAFEPLNRFEYHAEWTAARNDLRKEVELGKRKVVGNINKFLVDEATYHTTEKQARNLQQAALRMGRQLSLAQVRGGMFDWNTIEEEQDRLRQMGLTSVEVKLYIGQQFFGSK